MRVPYFEPTWGRAEEAAVRRVLRSGWITMGGEVRQFEAELASYTGARHAVAVNSCTAALHLALVAAGIQSTQPVVVPVYTFTASAGAILQAGARPIFADIDPRTLNIDPESAARVAPRRVAAWMPVDMAGLPANYSAIRKLAKKKGGVIVADAAHSLGAAVGKMPVGRLADISCFSFYANKNLTTAEGGMAVTNNRTWDERLRILRLHGMSRDAWKRYDKNGSWYYEIDRHGFKYNQNDILAALGRAQLAKFDRMQAQRARAAGWYDRYLDDIEEVIPAPRQANRTHAWHLYVIRLRGKAAGKRNNVIEYLRKKGVDTSVHFIPLCLQPYWKRKYRLKARDFPNAVAAYRGAISLPMHPGLTQKQCRYVADTLKKALTRV
jgi:perosamine synthetase